MSLYITYALWYFYQWSWSTIVLKTFEYTLHLLLAIFTSPFESKLHVLYQNVWKSLLQIYIISNTNSQRPTRIKTDKYVPNISLIMTYYRECPCYEQHDTRGTGFICPCEAPERIHSYWFSVMCFVDCCFILFFSGHFACFSSTHDF